MAKAKVEDQDDIQNITSKTHAGNPSILIAPTSKKSGRKMILVSTIKLATGFLSFFFLFMRNPHFKLSIS